MGAEICPAMQTICQFCGRKGHIAPECPQLLRYLVPAGHYPNGCSKGKHWWPKGKGKSKLDSPCAGGGEPDKGRTKGKGMRGKGMRGNAEAVESTAVADRHEIIKKKRQ